MIINLFSWSCLIDDGSSFLLTGGNVNDGYGESSSKVSRYNIGGYIEDLDDLNIPRGRHGCGSFVDSSGRKV